MQMHGFMQIVGPGEFKPNKNIHAKSPGEKRFKMSQETKENNKRDLVLCPKNNLYEREDGPLGCNDHIKRHQLFHELLGHDTRKAMSREIEINSSGSHFSLL